MESKKVSKKLNTIFWYTIYSLPLLFLFVYFIGYLAIFKETGAVPSTSVNVVFSEINNIFSGFTWGVIKDTLNSVLNSIGFTVSGDISTFVILIFTWFVQFSFIHILIDFLLFIPRFFHNVFERWS